MNDDFTLGDGRLRSYRVLFYFNNPVTLGDHYPKIVEVFALDAFDAIDKGRQAMSAQGFTGELRVVSAVLLEVENA